MSSESVEAPSLRSKLLMRFGGLLRSIGGVNARWWMIYDLPVAYSSPSLVYIIFEPGGGRLDATLMHMAGFTLAVLLTGNICGLYDREVFLSWSRMLVVVAVTAALSALFFGLITNVFLLKKVGRFVLLYTGGIFFAAAFFPRILSVLSRKRYRTYVVMVGNPGESSQLTLCSRIIMAIFSF